MDNNCAYRLRKFELNVARYELARRAKWFSVAKSHDDEDEPIRIPALPPIHVCHDLLAMPDMPFPRLHRIVTVPVFAPDGRLLTDAGYNASNQSYYAPPKGFVLPNIPKNPLKEDIERAKSLLLDELFVGFPFASDADKAHALCACLLHFVRDMIDGATPLHLIEAPSPGTGKDLLAEVIILVTAGMTLAGMTEGRDEDEWRKRITATLMEAPTYILIDNLDFGTFHDPSTVRA